MIHSADFILYSDSMMVSIPYSTMVFKDLFKSFQDDFPARVWRKECKTWCFPLSDYHALIKLLGAKKVAIKHIDKKEETISTQDRVEFFIYKGTKTVACRASFDMVRKYSLIDEFKKRGTQFVEKTWDSIKKMWYYNLDHLTDLIELYTVVKLAVKKVEIDDPISLVLATEGCFISIQSNIPDVNLHTLIKSIVGHKCLHAGHKYNIPIEYKEKLIQAFYESGREIQWRDQIPKFISLNSSNKRIKEGSDTDNEDDEEVTSNKRKVAIVLDTPPLSPITTENKQNSSYDLFDEDDDDLKMIGTQLATGSKLLFAPPYLSRESKAGSIKQKHTKAKSTP